MAEFEREEMDLDKNKPLMLALVFSFILGLIGGVAGGIGGYFALRFFSLKAW
jgi:hypothetical protein